jgi:threonyl-tRNA synthetase
MGRFVALLLEHHEGALPFWLSPEQVAVAPIGPDQESYADEVLAELRGAGLRARLLPPRESLSRRIVEAHDQRIPVVAVLGSREAERRTVSLRGRSGQGEVALSEMASAAKSLG